MKYHERLYIKNSYLDYLIFGHWSCLRCFFEGIPSWVYNNQINRQEAKYLLTEMVSDIFDIPLDVSFGYRTDVVRKIKSKRSYSLIETTMKAEILRLYNITQDNLKSVTNTNSVLLYRGLNRPELQYFYKDPINLKTNTLSSFTTNKDLYQNEIQVSVEVPIKNILFFENLSPLQELLDKGRAALITTGLYAEREVIVMNKEKYFNIKEVTYLSEATRMGREIEEV
ncbi:hypothetical protein GLW04_19360 [Halobacillus litoralis]|uniref:Uncharacterized protein n=1 Tax=Halobacillus litoralis TaxID=45668 RepID=A0A845DXC8_9BACI|nr:NAD(+)--dinitrogen-reductase ADP-D-ribosyltransferase [Halobacillus litoralis]MYL22036.1 hypothetical protein [Halobacillus litoralis]